MEYLNGLKVYVTNNIKPSSKGIRVKIKKKNKWNKRYKINYKEVSATFQESYVFADSIIIHPDTYEKLKKLLKPFPY